MERIEGLLSGTLGYVLSEVSAGVPFSQAVRSAMAKGYTEPDPRDDLSGMDVARKALILARLLGYPGELAPRFGGVPGAPVGAVAPAEGIPRPAGGARRRLEAAGGAGRGRRDRCCAMSRWSPPARSPSECDRCRSTSPFAAIKGSDNQLVFTTARYKTNPLVITGPGAGAEVTAAGVLNDILRLAGA